jgi:spermidine/putrescine transport system ATP-binding protein
VADFIGDSNIVDGVMHKDFLVSFSGVQFPCVDRGFAREQSVQVVVRPEDIEVVSPMEGQLVGVVNDVIFKGVHFEMHVDVEGREWLIPPVPAPPARPSGCASAPTRSTSWRVREG